MRNFQRFAQVFQVLIRPLEAMLRPLLRETHDFEASGTLGFIIRIKGSQQVGTAICDEKASRTWASRIINTWSQLVTEDALEKNFSPDACAKSSVSLQASCQFIFSVSSLSTYFSTLHGGEGPYSRWGRRPEPEALKSDTIAVSGALGHDIGNSSGPYSTTSRCKSAFN